MDYFCDECDKNIKLKSKYKLFKSNSLKEFEKCKHILLSLEDIDIKNVDEAFYLYIIEHNKKFDFYLVNTQFNLVFHDYQYCPYVTSNLSDNRTMISWSNFFTKK